MGIVDFLQNWTLRKKTERAMKIYLLGQEAEGTSVMHPDPYKERFQNKMDEIFDLELLESRRRKKMKNKKNGTQAANEKKRISGRAFAPAGTTLNKNKSKSTTSVSSVGFVVDAPEEESELPPAAVDIIQQTRPFGANGTPGASPTVKNSVRFSNQVDDATNPLLKQEFSDVQI